MISVVGAAKDDVAICQAVRFGCFWLHGSAKVLISTGPQRRHAKV
jgi:hypothetical protein